MRQAMKIRSWRWTAEELNMLRQLAETHTPARIIAQRLGRSEQAVRQRASAEGISLRTDPER